jgi:preprotein translocase subunit SecE
VCIFVSGKTADAVPAKAGAHQRKNTMADLNPAKFIREVRTEVGKVTWPTRKETMVSTMMVLILAGVAAIFFLIVDGIFAWGIGEILGLAKK